MMLNMSNKFSNYQHMAGNANASTSSAMALNSTSPCMSALATPNTFSQDSNSSITSNSGGNKAERESIHSGQFMVSTFEAEEAQDDLDDSEVKMLDPEDPSLSKTDDEPNTCMEVQLYVPRKVTQQHRYGTHEAVGLITSHLEIETSLTKLFKCMNLAYSQKLTSPKWNHFKGVRLRWKDKIRLNNVIWRCWHMQFILKRRTPVCQFASPLDVDIHSNPQSVVLEGKYWKRQLAVIKAEYRKWRRNYKSKATGCLLYDTRSEFDFLEWSPLNDKNLMLSDDWTSDTLFSAINGPFPFPDSREIARGAGIADFIQPSLGPLQPNLDDIDLTFVELLQNSRLPPVPEEGTDEMIKNVDYGFSSIMGHEHMDSNNMMDVTSSSIVGSMANSNDDTNMMDLNTPLNALQYSDIEQQFANRGRVNNVQLLQAENRRNDSNLQALSAEDAIMGEPQNDGALIMSQVERQQHQHLKTFSSSTNRSVGGLGLDNNNAISNSSNNMMGRQSSTGNDFPVKKGRVSKSSQRPFRREPHNYDKAQPTLHQTNIYQQMLAEQQKGQQIQQLQQPSMSVNSLQHQASIYQTTNQQQQQQQQQPQQQHQTITNTFPMSQQQYDTNLLNTSTNFASSSDNIATGGIVSGTVGQSANSGSFVSLMNEGSNIQSNSLHSIKIEVPSTDVLSMFNLSQNSEGYASGNQQYKPYTHVGNFKKSASTGTYINIRGPSTGANQMYMSPPDQNLANMHAQSLPLTLGLHLPGLTNALQQQQQQQQQQTQHHLRPAQLSPPNIQQQQQQLQQHQLSSSQRILPPTQISMNQQQQQQLQHTPQTNLQSLLAPQQQQQTQASSNAMPKEIFRSNSLPLNVSIQKLDTRLTQHDNFAVPKSHVISKTGKARSRSNSIHQHMIQSSATATAPSSSNLMSVVSSGKGFLTTSGLGINTQLQTATSDPMLNSTLAQLLTTNSRISTLGKQQSISTSAITAIPNVAMDTLQLPNQMKVQSKINNRTGPTSSNMFMPTVQQQQQQQSQQQQQQQQSLSSPPSPTVVQHQQSQQQLQHTKQVGQTQQHLQHQSVHKSPKKTTSLPSPAAPSMLSSPPSSKVLSFPLTASTQTNLSLSPESFHDQDSPLSPTQCLKYPRDSQRRAGHIHAEQKRRYNIKNGFDQLHDLIPQLQLNNAKLSKAAMLQKGAEHIKHLRNERNVLKERMETLRMERDSLNNSLTHLHSILPANGAPVTRQGTEHVRQLYEQYVRNRTQDNWKFWILGLILEPLLTSYTSTVSSASLDELRRTAFLWVDQHCSLIDLRPAVSNKLKYLSMKTDILSDPPSTLKEEIAKAVHNTSGQHPNLHGT